MWKSFIDAGATVNSASPFSNWFLINCVERSRPTQVYTSVWTQCNRVGKRLNDEMNHLAGTGSSFPSLLCSHTTASDEFPILNQCCSTFCAALHLISGWPKLLEQILRQHNVENGAFTAASIFWIDLSGIVMGQHLGWHFYWPHHKKHLCSYHAF